MKKIYFKKLHKLVRALYYEQFPQKAVKIQTLLHKILNKLEKLNG